MRFRLVVSLLVVVPLAAALSISSADGSIGHAGMFVPAKVPATNDAPTTATTGPNQVTSAPQPVLAVAPPTAPEVEPEVEPVEIEAPAEPAEEAPNAAAALMAALDWPGPAPEQNAPAVELGAQSAGMFPEGYEGDLSADMVAIEIDDPSELTVGSSGMWPAELEVEDYDADMVAIVVDDPDEFFDQ